MQFFFQTPKWYPLLHSKYSKSKPEIRLAIYLEDDKNGAQETSFKAKDAPARRTYWHMICVIITPQLRLTWRNISSRNFPFYSNQKLG